MLVILALAFTATNAASVIHVEGVRGSGKTTWTLSGSGTFTFNGNIRTSTESNNFSSDDTMQATDNGRFLSARTTVGENSLFAVTGSAKITVGSRTRTITHIFLDPDDGDSGDDFGIRVRSGLRYLEGQISRWSGRFTVPVDISNFNPGTYRSDGFIDFAQPGDVILNFKETIRIPDIQSPNSAD